MKTKGKIYGIISGIITLFFLVLHVKLLDNTYLHLAWLCAVPFWCIVFWLNKETRIENAKKEGLYL